MTGPELDYLKQAVAAIEQGEMSPMTQASMLAKMAQICQAESDRIRADFERRVQINLARAAR